jgi:O-Antigen ligase
MPTLDYILIFLLGFSLWLPGLSLYNIGSSGGIQICTVLSLILVVRLIFQVSSGKIKVQHVGNQLWTIHALFLGSSFISVIFSSVGVDRSLQTLVAELIGLTFSLSLSLLFCSGSVNITAFYKGFWNAGFLSSLYAIYQVIGLKSNLPFSYIAMNNPSFSILDADTAQYHSRSLGLTPEPSILASLIIMIIGMSVVNVIIKGGLKNYLMLSIVFLGFLSTSSQSISVLPMYIISIYFTVKILSMKRRSIVMIDYAGILLVVVMAIILYLSNPSIISTLSRLALDSTDFSESNASAASRFSDMTTAIALFLNHPLVGNGLGAYTDLAEIKKAALNLDGQASAASGALRLLAEQGLLGLLYVFVATKILWPIRIFKCLRPEKLVEVSYSLSIILSLVLSLVFFVGYRNLYHLWLLIPIGLKIKSDLCDFQLNERV